MIPSIRKPLYKGKKNWKKAIRAESFYIPNLRFAPVFERNSYLCRIKIQTKRLCG